MRLRNTLTNVNARVTRVLNNDDDGTKNAARFIKAIIVEIVITVSIMRFRHYSFLYVSFTHFAHLFVPFHFLYYYYCIYVYMCVRIFSFSLCLCLLLACDLNLVLEISVYTFSKNCFITLLFNMISFILSF